MSLEDRGYTEIVKRIPLTDDEVRKYQPAVELSDYMRKRLNEVVTALLEDCYQREQEAWEALATKANLDPRVMHIYGLKAMWVLRELHVVAKPGTLPPDEPDAPPVP